ncbi:MAG: DNA adenine methylase [Nitrospirales bacterium]|nr:DNA adenine methylase [Nitrospirales bacterium]
MKKSFLSYLGGKSLLANRIIRKIPEHSCYCEVFAGAAWLLFKKEESEIEVLNDINTDIVTLYRVVRCHLDEFIRYFRWLLVSRDEFERFKKEAPESLTDIQRAVRFYYLMKTCYGAKMDLPTFSASPTRPPRLNLLRIEEELSQAHLRLSRVFIENRPYANIIERFDRPETFFYVDPPYYGCENDYGKGIFSREDFQVLAGMLKAIKGRFIMSINDHPEIRNLYKDFRIEETPTSYSVSGGSKKVMELLIMNFDGIKEA